MNKLAEDIACLTTIPVSALLDLEKLYGDCLVHNIYENLICGNNPIEVDIGIGTLYIKLEDANIKYKFIPSKNLEETVAQTIRTKTSPVTIAVNTALRKRIENVYKQLL